MTLKVKGFRLFYCIIYPFVLHLFVLTVIIYRKHHVTINVYGF